MQPFPNLNPAQDVGRGEVSSSSSSTQGGQVANAHPGNKPDKSAFVDAEIIKAIPDYEIGIIAHKMSNRGFKDRAAWPSHTFAEIYLYHGTQEEVKQYARRVAQMAESAHNLIRTQQRNLGDMSPSSSVEEITLPLSLALQTHSQARRRQGVWNATDPGMNKESIDVGTLFNCIDHAKRKILLKDIKRYDPLNEKLKLRDWCTWYDANRHYLSSLPREQANFVLLNSVPEQYTDKIIKNERQNLLTTATLILGRRIGSVVYKRTGVDPLVVANNLNHGEYNIAEPSDLFRRIIELHYCTYRITPGEIFLLDMYKAITQYIPFSGQAMFVVKVEQEYPALEEVQYPSLEDDVGEMLHRGKKTNDTVLPDTPSGIHTYAEFLKAQAIIACLKHKGPIYCNMRKDHQNRGRGRIVQAAANTAAHVRPNNTRQVTDQRDNRIEDIPFRRNDPPRREATPRREDVMRRDEVPRRGDPIRNDEVPRREDAPRVCTHCHSKTHWIEECWFFRPEIEQQRKREIADKKKTRNADRLAKHQAKMSQYRRTDVPSRRELTPARGGYQGDRRNARSQQVNAVQVQDQPRNNVGDFRRSDA